MDSHRGGTLDFLVALQAADQAFIKALKSRGRMRQCPFVHVPCRKESGDMGRHYSDERAREGSAVTSDFSAYPFAATSPPRDQAFYKQKGAMAVRLNKEPLSHGARKFVGAGSAYPHRPEPH